MNKRPAELQRDRNLWKTRVEEKRRFQAKKKEAREFFRRVPSFKPKKQEHFEEEFKQKVMTGYYSGSPEGRERYLDEWTVSCRRKRWRKTVHWKPGSGRRWEKKTLLPGGARSGREFWNDQYFHHS